MHPFETLREVAVIDCETTGTDPLQDRIVSVGVVLVDLGGDEEHRLPTLKFTVNPGVSIPAEAAAIHGIADDDVEDLGSFAEWATKLTDFVADRPLVGFNVSFHKRFLNAELKRHGCKSFHRKRSYCVQEALRMAWDYRPSFRNAAERLTLGEFAPDKIRDPLTDALVTTFMAGLLHRTPLATVVKVPGGRWDGIDDKPPTPRQLEYIQDLGGDPGLVRTRRQASETIDRLKTGQGQGGQGSDSPGTDIGNDELDGGCLIAALSLFARSARGLIRSASRQ